MSQHGEMHPAISEYNELLIRDVILNLENRRMNGYFAETPERALGLCRELIPAGTTVTQGGSVTLDQCGIRNALLASTSVNYIDPYAPGLDPAQRMDLRRKALLSDVFICSTNAITRDGILVNRDGIGNRVAAMIFGPEKVIIVAGVNKIVPDIESAINRINSLAAPQNCIRLKRQTPCATETICQDCQSPGRICSATSIIEWQWTDRIHVILVNSSLGF